MSLFVCLLCKVCGYDGSGVSGLSVSTRFVVVMADHGELKRLDQHGEDAYSFCSPFPMFLGVYIIICNISNSCELLCVYKILIMKIKTIQTMAGPLLHH